MNQCNSKLLPKINLSFKRIAAQVPKNEIPAVKKSEFFKLIPDKINKQVLRLKRKDEEANRALVEMKDGATVKLSHLIDTNASKENRIKEKRTVKDNKDYLYRKLRLSSSILEELITFFSGDLCPKILNFDRGLWTITQVKLL